MILLIDNYDSFSYNLYQFVGMINKNIHVARNDEISIDDIEKMKPSHIILSPGPGYPKDAGICIDVVENIKNIPILGVCLGHQAICEAFGATISHAKEIMHGKKSEIEVNSNCPIFHNLPMKFKVGRYHSLAAEREKIPAYLKIVAQTNDGEIMAVMHENELIYGVQFHPESILTEYGKNIIENFLTI